MLPADQGPPPGSRPATTRPVHGTAASPERETRQEWGGDSGGVHWWAEPFPRRPEPQALTWELPAHPSNAGLPPLLRNIWLAWHPGW